MDQNKHDLNDPAAVYGRKIRVGELNFEPMENAVESLRAQGYISLEEFVERVSSR